MIFKKNAKTPAYRFEISYQYLGCDTGTRPNSNGHYPSQKSIERLIDQVSSTIGKNVIITEITQTCLDASNYFGIVFLFSTKSLEEIYNLVDKISIDDWIIYKNLTRIRA